MAYSTDTIGKGAFGKVYKQKYNDTWAAIKKVPVDLISKKDLEREWEVYIKAEHPNIVKLLGNITLQEGKWIIPLEFIFGEELKTTIFIAAKSKIQLSPSVKGTIIIGMCEGLFHMHSKDIVHQDLKPENIMVEHNTNRAVIIDMGLAKFFRNGLNSAKDGGTPAYTAPEVHRGSSRDQRSDVWAMGKIIAELCARIQLHPPSVCPDMIKAVLKDQPFCHAVCKMVEADPSIRASMGGIISNIRSAGEAGTVKSTPVQKGLLKLTLNNARYWSPSPMNRGVSPVNRVPSPMVPSPMVPSPMVPSPMNRGVSPVNWVPSPMVPSPMVPSPMVPSPMNRGVSPVNWVPSPMVPSPMVPSPMVPSPMNRGVSPVNWVPSPMNRLVPLDLFPRPRLYGKPKVPQFGPVFHL